MKSLHIFHRLEQAKNENGTLEVWNFIMLIAVKVFREIITVVEICWLLGDVNLFVTYF